MLKKVKKIMISIICLFSSSCTLCLVIGALGAAAIIGTTVWALGEYSSMIFTVDSVVAISDSLEKLPAKTETSGVLAIDYKKKDKGTASYSGNLNWKKVDAQYFEISGTLKVTDINAVFEKTPKIYKDIMPMITTPETKGIVVYENVKFAIKDDGGKVLGLSSGFIRAKGQADRSIDCSKVDWACKIGVGVEGNKSLFDKLEQYVKPLQ